MDREMDVAMATANQEGVEQDYQEFLEDLEEDKNYRKNVNIFFSELVEQTTYSLSNIVHSLQCNACMDNEYVVKIVTCMSLIRFVHLLRCSLTV